jgi:hypothetical protein
LTSRIILACIFLLPIVATMELPVLAEDLEGKEQTQLLKAARVFADALVGPDSPEHTAVFRKALEAGSLFAPISDGQIETTRSSIAPKPLVGLLDHDQRYRENLFKSKPVESGRGPYSIRVWGGRISLTGEYLSTVGVKGSRQNCTGVYIGSKHVVTAAHCLCNNTIERIVFGEFLWPSQDAVSIDPNQTKTMSDCPVDYSEGDIALLTMTRDPLISVLAADLVATTEIDTATTVNLVGFGETSPRESRGLTGNGVGIKRVGISHIATINCAGRVESAQKDDSEYYGCVEGLEFVAGEIGSDVDTCNGDSGSPVFIDHPSASFSNPTLRSYSVIGITSRKVNNGRECGDGGIYIRIDGKVAKWIAENIKDGQS